MKQYKIIQFGKTKDKGLLAVQDDYAFRLSKFAAVERVIWKSLEKKEASDKVINYCASHPQEKVLVLDETGVQPDTKDFERTLTTHHDNQDIITFIIGDATGFDARVKQETNSIALSKMTFPHELALTLLLEQLYRIETLRRNHPYHKD